MPWLLVPFCPQLLEDRDHGWTLVRNRNFMTLGFNQGRGNGSV